MGTPTAPNGVANDDTSAAYPPAVLTQLTYVPTCANNFNVGGDAICPQALKLCPPPAVAYWVYSRTLDTGTGTASAWSRRSEPPFECIQGAPPSGFVTPAPAIPLHVRVAALLRQQFAELPLPHASIEVRPQNETLINVETRFMTSTGSQELPPLILLGHSVTVTANAEHYEWHFGDDSTKTDAGPGSSAAPIRHVYRAPGPRQPFVSITWSGTFRIAGDPTTYPIVGTATTDGLPANLAVRTAHSVLVSR